MNITCCVSREEQVSKLNTQQVPPEDIVPYLFYVTFVLLCLWMLAFSVPGCSKLFTGSTLNALDLCMKYTSQVIPHPYILKQNNLSLVICMMLSPSVEWHRDI